MVHMHTRHGRHAHTTWFTCTHDMVIDKNFLNFRSADVEESRSDDQFSAAINDSHVLCVLLTHAGEFVVGRGFNDASTSESAEDADESSSSSTDESSVNETFDFGGNENFGGDTPALTPIDTLHISRRRPEFGVVEGNGIPPDLPPRVHPGRYRDVACEQILWREHAASAAVMFPKNTWRMLQAVQTESKVTQSKVLKACTSFLTPGERKKWPLTRQKVEDTLTRWPNQMHTRHAHTTCIHDMHARHAHTT